MQIQAFVEAYVIPAQLVLAMLGMGATLSAGDFMRVVRDAKGVIIGAALQWLFVPALALAFIYGLGLSPGWAVGLILVAVVPGGAFSNLLTFLGNGNTALSVSVTLLTTVLSIFTTPALLGLLAATHMPADFQVPTAHIISEIFKYLVLPLLLGMWILRLRPEICPTLSKWSVRASILGLLIVVVSSLGTGRIKIAEYGWGPPLTLIAFGTALAWITPWICYGLRRFDDDNVALSIEVAVRNIALALLLVHFFFPGSPAQGHVLYSCLFYGGMSFFLGVPIVVRNRKDMPITFGLPRRRRPDEPAGSAGHTNFMPKDSN